MEEPKLQMDEIYRASLALNRVWVDISMFVGFAPANGEKLKNAASDLLGETASWIKNKESDVRESLRRQLAFNENARKVHAELLGVKESED